MGKRRKNEWEIRNTQKYDRKTNSGRIMVGLTDYNKNNKNNIIIISYTIGIYVYINIYIYFTSIIHLHAPGQVVN